MSRLRWRPLMLVSAILCGVFFLAQSLNIDDDAELPPDVPKDGIKVLLPIPRTMDSCGGSGRPAAGIASVDISPSAVVTARRRRREATATLMHVQQDARSERSGRREFACAAGCAEREPQLEASLSPYAMWDKNTSAMDMLELVWGFCSVQRDCKDPFIIAVVWQGAVHLKDCGAKEGLRDPGLYLIGPEDLSLAIVNILSVAFTGALDWDTPVVFGMYLSDYTCVLDRHLYGPGVPIFSYLTRDTSWLIPWPSSFTVISSMDSEKSKRTGKKLKSWSNRKNKAYWIGAITGPWEFSADADLLALPRLKLLKMASINHDELEAEWSNTAGYGISWIADGTSVSGFHSDGAREVSNITGIKASGWKHMDTWANYKYYLNLDGVVMGGRLNRLMSLGGVVLQHNAGYHEYLDSLIKPYVHYVPVEYDLSDLVEKVKWLQRNDRKAKQIADAAHELAFTRMRMEDHLCYIWRALEALQDRTCAKLVDKNKFRSRLAELQFESAGVVEGGLRPTLERFWNLGPLDDVTLGRRTMNKKGINVLEYAWARLESMVKKTGSKAKAASAGSR